eukprot:3218029-Prymnesium_polylepis.2
MKDAQEAATDVVEFDPQKLTLPSYVALRPTHDQDKFKAERLDSLRAALKRQASSQRKGLPDGGLIAMIA